MHPFNPPGVWQPRGRGFSMGMVQPQLGHTVRFTGQVAWDADEKIVGRDDIQAQTRQCFRNIETILAHVGGTLDDLVEIMTWYTDPAQLPSIQEVRLEFLSERRPPVSTSVMVAGLGHPDFLVELTPVAVVPPERFRMDVT